MPMLSLAQRISGSLAVKALPAVYGVALILLVVRAIPLGDFGRYGMAIAFVNVVVALSRGLWATPLIVHAARGDRSRVLAPAFWLSGLTAAAGGLLGLIILPLIGVEFPLALMAAVMLLILVPRDMALSLAQAESRVWAAFSIESGYFGGSLLGFALLSVFGVLKTAEAAMFANVAAAALSALIGLILEPGLLRLKRRGDYHGILRLGRWTGLLAFGEIFIQQGDALLVGIFFQPEIIAPYLAARTLLRMYTLISQAVNFLVLPSASRLGAENRLRHLRARLRTALTYVCCGLVPLNIAAWLLSPIVFPLIMGEKYLPAVPFFRLMIVITFLEPIYSVLSNAVAGLGKPSIVVPVVLAGLVLNVVANLGALPVFGLWSAPVVLILTYGMLAWGCAHRANTILT
jgi:O-antigen/teichoic acid export membrane protein